MNGHEEKFHMMPEPQFDPSAEEMREKLQAAAEIISARIKTEQEILIARLTEEIKLSELVREQDLERINVLAQENKALRDALGKLHGRIADAVDAHPNSTFIVPLRVATELHGIIDAALATRQEEP